METCAAGAGAPSRMIWAAEGVRSLLLTSAPKWDRRLPWLGRSGVQVQLGDHRSHGVGLTLDIRSPQLLLHRQPVQREGERKVKKQGLIILAPRSQAKLLSRLRTPTFPPFPDSLGDMKMAT